MLYKLVVDKQSILNPSSEIKIYTLDIEELRTDGIIADELIITPNESYVLRKFSLSKYHVFKKLETPIKEIIENPQIKLFEGSNYIYLIDMVGNKFYAEYLIKSKFNDTFPTKTEMMACINILSSEINIELAKKVNDEDLTGAQILLRVNNDKSEAKIKADKIGLEGYTTINGGFKVDEEGNAEIANGAVKINNLGIQMLDGTGIVGGDGVYTSLSYTGQGKHIASVVGQGNFQFLGFTYNGSSNIIYKNYLFIDVFVPANFTLRKAYLNLQHLPIVIGNTSGTVSDYGICSNIKLYKTNIDSQQIYVVPQSDTSITGISNLNEISVLGISGWTPTRPDSVSGVSLEQKNVEIPISNFNTGGKLTRFAVTSDSNTPASSGDIITTMFKHSRSCNCYYYINWLFKRLKFLGLEAQNGKN